MPVVSKFDDFRENYSIFRPFLAYFGQFWLILATQPRLRVPDFLIIIMVSESERLRAL